MVAFGFVDFDVVAFGFVDFDVSPEVLLYIKIHTVNTVLVLRQLLYINVEHIKPKHSHLKEDVSV